MSKKIFLSLFILCFLFPTVSSIHVVPDTVDVDIDENQYLVKQMEITSTLGSSVNISIDTDMSITFSKTGFTLGVNESEIITMHLFGQESTGYINITYDSFVKQIPVVIHLKQHGQSNDSITIFPSVPTSGSMFILALPDAVDVSGFIWVNNKMYPVYIKDGFTTVELENIVYGEAQLWLYGEGFVHTFDIECGLEGKITLESADEIGVDEILEVTLKIGGEPLINTGIIVTDMDGDAYPFKTDDEGKIYPLIDKVGEWTLRAEFQGKQDIKKVSASYKVMSVTVNKQSLNIGESVVITTGQQQATILIKKDGASQFQTNVEYGALEYNPLSVGEYIVEAVSGNKKGSTSFTVNMQTSIRILDKNNMQTSIIKQGGEYIIQVVDENGQPVSIYQSITAEKVVNQIGIIEPGDVFSEQLVTIPLDNGIGFWMPKIWGDYTLYIEDSGSYIGTSAKISIEKQLVAEETDMTLVYILTGVIVAISVVILVFYLNKKGVITLPNLPTKHKKIPDNLL